MAAVEAVVIHSTRKKALLVVDGYTFYCDPKNVEANKYYWLCSKSHEQRIVDGKTVKVRVCKARMKSSIVNGLHKAALTASHSDMCTTDPAVIARSTFNSRLKGK